jgi:hypothetical protein
MIDEIYAATDTYIWTCWGPSGVEVDGNVAPILPRTTDLNLVLDT